jgi:hypothetical protein
MVCAFLILFGTELSFAAPVSAVVTCQPGACRDVEPPQGGGSWCDPSRPSLAFELNLTEFKMSSDGKTLEWSPSDGDQYTLFALKTTNPANLAPGDTFTGSMSDAYWWANGDHVRSITDLTCVKN